MNALGPPAEAGDRANEIRPLLEGSAAGELRIFQILDSGKVLATDQRRGGQWLEVFGRL